MSDTLTPIQQAQVNLIIAYLGNPAAFRGVQDRAIDEDTTATRMVVVVTGEIISGVCGEGQ